MKRSFQEGQMHIRVYPEDFVWCVCQHGGLLAVSTTMSHTPTAAAYTHTLIYSTRNSGEPVTYYSPISQCCESGSDR